MITVPLRYQLWRENQIIETLNFKNPRTVKMSRRGRYRKFTENFVPKPWDSRFEENYDFPDNHDENGVEGAEANPPEVHDNHDEDGVEVHEANVMDEDDDEFHEASDDDTDVVVEQIPLNEPQLRDESGQDHDVAGEQIPLNEAQLRDESGQDRDVAGAPDGDDPEIYHGNFCF